MIKIYVAAPYSSPTLAILEDRVRAVGDACAWLLAEGYLPMSPVAHWHVPARRNDLPTQALAWIEWNRAWLHAADALAVLRINGWRDSQGVALEMKWAQEACQPIWMVEAVGDGFRWCDGA